MRFASLGSGSRGNATLVEGGGTRILVDCGFSARELEHRLRGLEVAPDSLDALLVTHEHGDHARGVAAVARRHGLAVWATPGTGRAAGFSEVLDFHLFSCHGGPFRIGDLWITPFAVPHDAAEPCQYVIGDGRSRVGLLTDTGAFTPHILSCLHQVDALILECNHDSGMLARGPYPPALRARVGGGQGHLSNAQAAAILARLDHPGLRHLAVAHLSEKNNHPDLARQALLQVSASLESRMSVLSQDEPSGWFSL
ncbi:MAG: MBL fold metallo-hydrolase [Pseudomonadota bacterium]